MFALVCTHFLSCTEKSNDITCDVNGEIYAVGESYDAADGCNTCTCMSDGEGGASMGCTEMGCDDPEPMSCAEMSIENCEEVPSCTVIYGSPIFLDSDNECYVWANGIEELGCMDADMECTSSLKHGASTDNPSDCYGFGGCMPEGWGNCGLGDYPECE